MKRIFVRHSRSLLSGNPESFHKELDSGLRPAGMTFLKEYRVNDGFCMIVVFFLVTLLLPFSVSAGEVKVLTLQQALDIAAEKNRDIQKAGEYFSWVQGKYVEERAAAFPQLTLNGSAIISKDETSLLPDRQEIYSGEIGVTQTLFTWGKVGAAIRAAEEGFKTADEQLRFYRQAAYRDVSIAFYNVLLSRELHAIALQNLGQKERHFEEARRKYSAGVATDYEILAADVAVKNARPEAIRTKNRIRDSLDRLRFLLAIEDESIDVTGSLEAGDDPAVRSYALIYKTALEQRPEVRDLHYRINIAGELVTIANADDKPRLEFRGGYGWKWYETSDMDIDGKAWNAGMFLSFPFFDGMRTRGRVAQARSDLSSIKIDEEKLIDSIALQAREALNDVQESKQIVDALSGTVAQAEKLLSLAEKGYELGVKIRLEVEDAELNLQQAKGNLTRAWRDYMTARVNLLWVMGVLGESAYQ